MVAKVICCWYLVVGGTVSVVSFVLSTEIRGESFSEPSSIRRFQEK